MEQRQLENNNTTVRQLSADEVLERLRMEPLLYDHFTHETVMAFYDLLPREVRDKCKHSDNDEYFMELLKHFYYCGWC